MLLLVVVSVFLLVVLVVFAAAWVMDQKRATARVLHERLTAVQQAAERQPSEELALLRDELLSEIPALNRLLSRSQRISRLQRFLSQADMKVRAGKFLLIAATSAAFVGLIGMLWSRSVLVMLVLGLLGLAVPFAYASFRRTQRFHRFEELFPEAIELLARAVRAGHAFTTALELIANELNEPVSGEFRKLFEEQKFGLPVKDALLNLAERVPLVDVKFFVTAVMLQRETGGNLAEILDKLSYVIRERFKILRQVRVYTAQGRLTMMILMGLPPLLVVMMMFVSPTFIKVLFTDPIGHLLLVIGVVLQTIGFLLIRKIIHIQV
ncbi:MAG TPA: type II secretion system F family protein [Terriglobales bacterium]|nr:type II secretion system F family protein [Terriglobales bacterium]